VESDFSSLPDVCSPGGHSVWSKEVEEERCFGWRPADFQAETSLSSVQVVVEEPSPNVLDSNFVRGGSSSSSAECRPQRHPVAAEVQALEEGPLPGKSISGSCEMGVGLGLRSEFSELSSVGVVADESSSALLSISSQKPTIGYSSNGLEEVVEAEQEGAEVEHEEDEVKLSSAEVPVPSEGKSPGSRAPRRAGRPVRPKLLNREEVQLSSAEVLSEGKSSNAKSASLSRLCRAFGDASLDDGCKNGKADEVVLSSAEAPSEEQCLGEMSPSEQRLCTAGSGLAEDDGREEYDNGWTDEVPLASAEAPYIDDYCLDSPPTRHRCIDDLTLPAGATGNAIEEVQLSSAEVPGAVESSHGPESPSVRNLCSAFGDSALKESAVSHTAEEVIPSPAGLCVQHQNIVEKASSADAPTKDFESSAPPCVEAARIASAVKQEEDDEAVLCEEQEANQQEKALESQCNAGPLEAASSANAEMPAGSPSGKLEREPAVVDGLSCSSSEASLEQEDLDEAHGEDCGDDQDEKQAKDQAEDQVEDQVKDQVEDQAEDQSEELVEDGGGDQCGEQSLEANGHTEHDAPAESSAVGSPYHRELGEEPNRKDEEDGVCFTLKNFADKDEDSGTRTHGEEADAEERMQTGVKQGTEGALDCSTATAARATYAGSDDKEQPPVELGEAAAIAMSAGAPRPSDEDETSGPASSEELLRAAEEIAEGASSSGEAAVASVDEAEDVVAAPVSPAECALRPSDASGHQAASVAGEAMELTAPRCEVANEAADMPDREMERNAVAAEVSVRESETVAAPVEPVVSAEHVQERVQELQAQLQQEQEATAEARAQATEAQARAMEEQARLIASMQAELDRLRQRERRRRPRLGGFFRCFRGSAVDD